MDRTNFIHILYTFFDALTLFSKLSCYTSNQLNFIYYEVKPNLFFFRGEVETFSLSHFSLDINFVFFLYTYLIRLQTEYPNFHANSAIYSKP